MNIITAEKIKFIFIVSHLKSGSKYIVDIMNKRSDFYIETKKLNYKNPINALNIRKDKKKRICGAHLLFNYQFSSSEFYKFCKFIFIIRNGNAVEDMIEKKMLPQNAYRYYSFRLGRILEMAKCLPGALFLTRENLMSKKGIKLMKNYLITKNLFRKDRIILPPVRAKTITSNITETSNSCYSRYMEQFQKLDLLRV